MLHASVTIAEVEIHTERVDDVPLLVRQERRMGIPEIVDSVVECHGNRQGLSMGLMITGWVSHILSEADGRMSEVELWASRRLKSLAVLLAPTVRGKDFAEERVASGLRWLSDDDTWEAV